MASRQRPTQYIRICLLLLVLALLLATLFLRQTVTSTEANVAEPKSLQPPPIAEIRKEARKEIRKEIIRGTVARGDTATALLSDYFSAAELHELNQQCKSVNHIGSA
jgi:hypothetical protein